MRQVLQNINKKEATTVYYVGTFLDDFSVSLTFAIYAVFLLKSGLNFFQMNLINGIYMVTAGIMEIPTGAFADALGRKRSVLIAMLFSAIGLLLYPITRSFWVFIGAEILWAFSSAFASGAFDAWMVDTAKKQGFEGKVDFVFSQASIISRVAFIVAGFAGAYLAYVDMGLPFYLGGIIALAGFFFFYFFMEDDKVEGHFSWRQSFGKIKNIAKVSVRYAWRHHVIFWLILADIVVTIILQPLNMFWGPRFNGMAGDQVWMLGWLWAIMGLFMIFGSYIVQIFMKKGINYSFLMAGVCVLTTVAVAGSASSRILMVALPIYLMYEIGRGIYNPVFQAYLNQYAESERRATILSFVSMAGSMAAAIGLALFGWIATKTSIESSWYIAAAVSLLGVPLFLIAGKRENKKEESEVLQKAEAN